MRRVELEWSNWRRWRCCRRRRRRRRRRRSRRRRRRRRRCSCRRRRHQNENIDNENQRVKTKPKWNKKINNLQQNLFERVTNQTIRVKKYQVLLWGVIGAV